MNLWQKYFLAAAVLLRIGTLAVSIRHEAKLKLAGAVEHGKTNTLVLALFHAGFYLAAGIEAAVRPSHLDVVSCVGIAIYIFSALSLLIVISILGSLWTVKLLIAPDHTLVQHPLFRTLKHPNYFLNILPELVGLALALHAFLTLAIGLPLYLIPLTLRIRAEEREMKNRFPLYSPNT